MFGFTARTDSGNLLIVGSAKVYHLLPPCIFNGIFKMKTGGLASYASYSVYHPYPDPPIIFADLDVGETAATTYLVPDGDTGYWKFRAFGSVRDIASKFVAFGSIPVTSSGNGLAVFGPSGESLFSSSATPLWVVGYSHYADIQLASPGYDQINGTFPAGTANPIISCESPSFSYLPPTDDLLCALLKRTGTSTWSTAPDTGGTPTYRRTRAHTVLLADLVV